MNLHLPRNQTLQDSRGDPRVLRIALRATALRAALDPGDLGGPLAAGKAVRPRACPWPGARRAGAAVAGGCRNSHAGDQIKLVFDSQKRGQNYKSRPGNLVTAEPPGKAASHRTRCA